MLVPVISSLDEIYCMSLKTCLRLLYGSQSMPIVSKCYKVGDERANGGVRFMDEVSDGVGS